MWYRSGTVVLKWSTKMELWSRNGTERTDYTTRGRNGAAKARNFMTHSILRATWRTRAAGRIGPNCGDGSSSKNMNSETRARKACSGQGDFETPSLPALPSASTNFSEAELRQ